MAVYMQPRQIHRNAGNTCYRDTAECHNRLAPVAAVGGYPLQQRNIDHDTGQARENHADHACQWGHFVMIDQGRSRGDGRAAGKQATRHAHEIKAPRTEVPLRQRAHHIQEQEDRAKLQRAERLNGESSVSAEAPPSSRRIGCVAQRTALNRNISPSGAAP